MLSREQIKEQLAIIAKSPPPKELAFGAMCYQVRAQSSCFGYVCPTCGEKTLYGKGSEHVSFFDSQELVSFANLAKPKKPWLQRQKESVRGLIQFIKNDNFGINEQMQRRYREPLAPEVRILRSLESMRRLAQQIDKLDVMLDESQFCKHCSPGIQNPNLGLVVKYPDNPKPHRTWGVDWADLAMIKASIEGQLKYKNQREKEAPLKDHLPRLRELLGVTFNDTKQ